MDKNIPSYTIEQINNCADLETMNIDIRPLEVHVLNPNNLKFPHRHSFYTLIYISEGSGTHDIDFRRFEVLPNQLFFMNEGQVHEWDLKNIKGFTFFFKKDFYEVVEKSLSLQALPFFNNSATEAPMVIFDKDDALKIQSLFEEIMLEFTNKNPHHQSLIKSLLKIILIRSLRIYKPLYTNEASNLNVSKVRFFEQLIERHYLELKSVKEYADKMSLTANYLNAICSKTVGKSAGELIRNRVVLESKRLLLHSSMSICEMGYHLGYNDCSYFIRLFKNDTGVTPEQFRTNN